MKNRLSSLKPFLFNAYYSWLLDNEITPHILVDATVKDVVVPVEYVKDGSIMLSLLPDAIADFQLLKRGIAFKARFKGKSEDIYIPYVAIDQLIALESGSAFPIGKALEQLDLAPEAGDDDIYPDEGLNSDGPDFEVDEDSDDENSDEEIDENINNIADEDNEQQNAEDEETSASSKSKKEDPGFSFVDD